MERQDMWNAFEHAFKLKYQEVKTMETKSRYEVIADLEKQKRQLIVERDSLNDFLVSKQKEIKELKREVEDKIEDMDNFEKSMADKKETIKELISSIDLSLQRLSAPQEKKK